MFTHSALFIALLFTSGSIISSSRAAQVIDNVVNVVSSDEHNQHLALSSARGLDTDLGNAFTNMMGGLGGPKGNIQESSSYGSPNGNQQNHQPKREEGINPFAPFVKGAEAVKDFGKAFNSVESAKDALFGSINGGGHDKDKGKDNYGQHNKDNYEYQEHHNEHNHKHHDEHNKDIEKQHKFSPFKWFEELSAIIKSQGAFKAFAAAKSEEVGAELSVHIRTLVSLLLKPLAIVVQFFEKLHQPKVCDLRNACHYGAKMSPHLRRYSPTATNHFEQSLLFKSMHGGIMGDECNGEKYNTCKEQVPANIHEVPLVRYIRNFIVNNPIGKICHTIVYKIAKICGLDKHYDSYARSMGISHDMPHQIEQQQQPQQKPAQNSLESFIGTGDAGELNLAGDYLPNTNGNSHGNAEHNLNSPADYSSGGAKRAKRAAQNSGAPNYQSPQRQAQIEYPVKDHSNGQQGDHQVDQHEQVDYYELEHLLESLLKNYPDLHKYVKQLHDREPLKTVANWGRNLNQKFRPIRHKACTMVPSEAKKHLPLCQPRNQSPNYNQQNSNYNNNNNNNNKQYSQQQQQQQPPNRPTGIESLGFPSSLGPFKLDSILGQLTGPKKPAQPTTPY